MSSRYAKSDGSSDYRRLCQQQYCHITRQSLIGFRSLINYVECLQYLWILIFKLFDIFHFHYQTKGILKMPTSELLEEIVQP